jgi:hypothetical protein
VSVYVNIKAKSHGSFNVVNITKLVELLIVHLGSDTFLSFVVFACEMQSVSVRSRNDLPVEAYSLPLEKGASQVQ